MASNVKKYGFIHAKLRARLSTLVPNKTFQNMVEASDILEALQYLKNTPYETVLPIYHNTGDIKMGELELYRKEVGLYRELMQYVTDEVKEFVEALSLRYEIEALIDAFRFWFERSQRGRSVDESVSYMCREAVRHSIDLDTIVYADSTEEIVSHLEETPYRSAVQTALPEVKKRESLFPLEIALERVYYTRIIEKTETLKNRDREIAEKIIGIQLDIENINRVVRFIRYYHLEKEDIGLYLLPTGRFLDRSALLAAAGTEHPEQKLMGTLGNHYRDIETFSSSEGSKQESTLLLLTHFLEEVLQREITRLLVGYPFTIGIILAYCMIKQNEIRKIMYIINGKFYKLDTERIGRII